MNKIQKKKRPFVFGILTTPSKDIFHSNYHQGLLSGIVPRIKAAGGKLKIIMMPKRLYKNLNEILCRHELDGLLILTWRWIHPSVAKLIETGKHSGVLVVNDPVPGLRVNCLYADVDAGMRQAVRYLSKKGFRKIGMLHGPWEVPFGRGKKKVKVPFIDTQLKIKGLIAALKAERIACEQNGFRSGAANSEAEGFRVMKEWLREKDLPKRSFAGTTTWPLARSRP
jgi:DNA-binding LacI/PurR family transcriptional regulator